MKGAVVSVCFTAEVYGYTVHTKYTDEPSRRARRRTTVTLCTAPPLYMQYVFGVDVACTMKDASGNRFGLDRRCGRRLSLHFMSPVMTTSAPQGQFGCGAQACRVRTEVATGVYLAVGTVIHTIGKACR